jgi:hypothetical protein
MTGRGMPGVAGNGRDTAAGIIGGVGDIPDGRMGGIMGRVGGIAGMGGIVGRGAKPGRGGVGAEAGAGDGGGAAGVAAGWSFGGVGRGGDAAGAFGVHPSVALAATAAGAGAGAGADDAGAVSERPIGENSSSIELPTPTVMTPPHTEQRARMPAAGTLAGSTRNTDLHSGQETFTSPPSQSPIHDSHRQLSARPWGHPSADRWRTPNPEGSSRNSSSPSPGRSPAPHA